jgi:hypothetical protein
MDDVGEANLKTLAEVSKITIQGEVTLSRGRSEVPGQRNDVRVTVGGELHECGMKMDFLARRCLYHCPGLSMTDSDRIVHPGSSGARSPGDSRAE